MKRELGFLLACMVTLFASAENEQIKKTEEAPANGVQMNKATDFKIISATQSTDESGDSGYTLKMQWRNPKQASAITDYRLYTGDGEGTSGSVSENIDVNGDVVTATVFVSKIDLGHYDEETFCYEYGTNNMYVVLCYKNGLSDASNKVTWDFVNNSGMQKAVSEKTIPVAYKDLKSKTSFGLEKLDYRIVTMSDGTIKKLTNM